MIASFQDFLHRNDGLVSAAEIESIQALQDLHECSEFWDLPRVVFKNYVAEAPARVRWDQWPAIVEEKNRKFSSKNADSFSDERISQQNSDIRPPIPSRHIYSYEDREYAELLASGKTKWQIRAEREDMAIRRATAAWALEMEGK